MPRPRRRRRVRRRPAADFYKPAGIPKRELEEVNLKVEEVEALRLKDAEGRSQEDAADEMDVSQSTFHRILTSAREKVAEAVTEGMALRIEGGSYEIEE
ncbi:MAG: DUF134 domain-containing protein [Candidatus Nanohaloarchaeota archaeon QJJ-9]|nr:DUF134 domain-containing protein [Candidatus Nanohaloarchaeota archaeon QJJ-9]